MRGFDAVNVVAKAIEAAKEPTAPKIMAALKTLEARGLYGLNKFDQNGQGYCKIIVTQGKDGKYSVLAITPSSKLWVPSASTEAVTPLPAPLAAAPLASCPPPL